MDTNGVFVKVSTERLENAALQVEQQVSKMRQTFEKLGDIVQRSSSYWEGDGQTRYVDHYCKKQETIDEILRNFQSDVINLRTIAGVYDTTEAQATEMAETLSSDVIV